MATGRFITFEGGEGCGKSTQVDLLVKRLEDRGISVVQVREPGGTVISEQIRRMLKEELRDPPCDRAELLLFLAARAQLVREVIRPRLQEGAWVVSDRFSDSTIAYQGYGRGLPVPFIREAIGFACEGLVPDLTLLLDVEPFVSAQRMRTRERATNTASDRIELAGEEFHARLREGFHELARQNPKRIEVIDANGGVEDVEDAVWKSVKRFL